MLTHRAFGLKLIAPHSLRLRNRIFWTGTFSRRILKTVQHIFVQSSLERLVLLLHEAYIAQEKILGYRNMAGHVTAAMSQPEYEYE